MSVLEPDSSKGPTGNPALDVLEMLTDALLLVDVKGKCIHHANRAAREMFGFSNEEFRALSLDELSPASHPAPAPEMPTSDIAGQMPQGRFVEWRVRDRTGRVFWVDVSAKRFVQGDREILLVSMRDITHRKETEEELLRIRGALDDCGAAVIISDKEGNGTYLNVSFGALFGCTRDRASEVRLVDLFVEPSVAKDVISHVSTGGGWEAEARMVSRSGREFPALVRATPVLGEDYDVVGSIVILNDITELKQLQAQLLQAQNMKSIGQLAAGIAHEINTPTQYVGDNTRFLQDSFRTLMTVVRNYQAVIEQAKQGAPIAGTLVEMEAAVSAADIPYLEEEIPAAIQQSLEGIDRVSAIVRAMRQFTHPGTGERKTVDLNQTLQNTLLVARNEWRYVADVETRLDPDLPPVPCLPGAINQVFLNLVVNAAHAVGDVVKQRKACGEEEPKGKITVSTACDGDWVEVRVADSGTGIPEEVRNRVFDPFFTTKEVGKGTGQGLAISHAVVVEKHGGTLTFETEVGKGTVFIVRLPVRPELAAGVSA